MNTGMSAPESIEGAAQVSKLVGRKFPISVLLGLPEPLMPWLNRRNHQVADARQIFGGMRCGRRFWSCGNAARGRKTDRQDGGCGNCDRRNHERAAPDGCLFWPAHVRAGSLESSLSSVIG